MLDNRHTQNGRFRFVRVLAQDPATTAELLPQAFRCVGLQAYRKLVQTEIGMKKVRNRRWRMVILNKLQWALATRMLIHAMLFAGAAGLIGMISQFVSDPFAGFRANLTACWKSCGPILMALVCMLPIFVRDMLRFTNRVAGPIYHLTRTMQQLASGDENVPPLKFRKGDLCDDIPDAFNSMVEQLRESKPRTRGTRSTSAAAPELVEV